MCLKFLHNNANLIDNVRCLLCKLIKTASILPWWQASTEARCANGPAIRVESVIGEEPVGPGRGVVQTWLQVPQLDV